MPELGDPQLQTANSRVQTGQSRMQTGELRVQTGQLHMQTGELRVQTCDPQRRGLAIREVLTYSVLTLSAAQGPSQPSLAVTSATTRATFAGPSPFRALA
jgi:hypothetical protein